MSEEKTLPLNQDADHDTIPPSATTEYVEETARDSRQTDLSNNDNAAINKDPINVVVKLPNENYRPANIANIIASGGLVVNLILAIFTYYLFRKTVEANSTSQAALAEA